MKREIQDFNLIYISDASWYIDVQEGSGDLDQEDLDEGYVDYIYYTINERRKDGTFEEVDGGMILLTHLYQDFYNEEEVAKVVLEFIESKGIFIAVDGEGVPIAGPISVA